MDQQNNQSQEQSQQTMRPDNNIQHDTQHNASQGMSAKDNNTLMGVLSYLGVLVIIPLLTSKNNPSVKFHVKQGLILAIIEVIVWILGPMMWQLWTILQIVNLATLVLSIIGIVNVVQGKQKELPLVGSFASNFKF